MVFLVDYVARGLGAGAHVGAMIWVMYGLGSIVGPVTYGFLADKLGARLSIRLVLVVQAIAVGLLPIAGSFTALALLAVILGSFPPGHRAAGVGAGSRTDPQSSPTTARLEPRHGILCHLPGARRLCLLSPVQCSGGSMRYCS